MHFLPVKRFSAKIRCFATRNGHSHNEITNVVFTYCNSNVIGRKLLIQQVATEPFRISHPKRHYSASFLLLECSFKLMSIRCFNRWSTCVAFCFADLRKGEGQNVGLVASWDTSRKKYSQFVFHMQENIKRIRTTYSKEISRSKINCMYGSPAAAKWRVCHGILPWMWSTANVHCLKLAWSPLFKIRNGSLLPVLVLSSILFVNVNAYTKCTTP